MKEKILILIFLMFILSGCSADKKYVYEPPYLRDLAEKLNFYIGFASMNNFWEISDAKEYMEVAKREFNILTPENQMKWEFIEPERDKFNFGPADKHVRFALENNMIVHGHTLLWHNQLPSWLTSKTWTREELISILENHIEKVVGHYKGEVSIWDVVNEAIDDYGDFRRTLWYNIIGKKYIEIAFKKAREIDSNAILIYNDYNIEEINRKSDAVYNMVKDFKQRKIPIDGIGFQMHISIRGINYESFRRNLSRFRNLGMKLYITEMDVRMPLESKDFERQAEVYRNILKICLEEGIQGLQMWGFTDKYSWIPSFFAGEGYALIFDENYKPKPSYFALKEVLKEFANKK